MTGPLAVKQTPDALVFGLRVDERHCNRNGSVHGGMLSTLTDIALGNNAGMAFHADEAPDPGASTPALVTVSLHTDFLGSARVGDWLEVHVELRKVGGTLTFATATVRNDNVPIATTNGVYRHIRPRDPSRQQGDTNA